RRLARKWARSRRGSNGTSRMTGFRFEAFPSRNLRHALFRTQNSGHKPARSLRKCGSMGSGQCRSKDYSSSWGWRTDPQRTTMTQILALATVVYGSLLIAAVYFTRATPRRIAGALAGGVAVAVVGAGVEATAHNRGWWRYTSGDSPYGPPGMYPLIVI